MDKLVRSLVSVGNKKFVPENLIQDFKFDSKTNVTINLAQCLFKNVMNNMTEKNDMLFQEWKELFNLSENDRGQNLDIEKCKLALGKIFNVEITDIEMDYKALFVLQTTYAIINILEGYSSSTFSYGYTAIDIFKDLYMEIMPNEVRHSLGEYFTPSWLADYVIENGKGMVTNNNWRAIDPCCGSGIFVVSLIKHVIDDVEIFNLSSKERKDLLNSIIERVQGIDIKNINSHSNFRDVKDFFKYRFF